MSQSLNPIRTEVQAIAAVDDALSSLEDDAARSRVLAWAISKFGPPGTVATTSPRANEDGRPPGVETQMFAVNSAAQLWLRRNGIVVDDRLASIFSIDQDVIDIVAEDIPGDSTRGKMRNVFLLRGACAYIETGESRFADQHARTTCRHYGAYDQSNFSNTVKAMADEISGGKESGYALTPKGLRSAADLIKAMLSTAGR